MKRLFPIILFALIAGFTACDDDDDKKVTVNEAVKSFIEQKYSGATIRSAEYDRDGLLEVEFLHDNHVKDAYFNSANKWLYTEWDIAIASLPQVVTDAVAQAYPDFRIDDADYIETESNAYYEIEIDKGGVEQWIFVTPDGKIVDNAGDDNTPEISEAVKSFIEQNYPDATILSAERDKDNFLNIEILHENIVKDLYFDNAQEWVLTKWDVAVASLPQAVIDAAAQAYPDYRIDDADYIVTPSATYYKIEVERGNFENTVYVTSDGTILS